MRTFVGRVILALAVAMTAGCGRQTTLPMAAETGTRSTPTEETHPLPFAREGQAIGMSPTSSFIPPPASLPAGMPVTIRLRTALSSASARAGDTFAAVLDEPIIVAGQILAERGAVVTGRIIDAQAAVMGAPGYLRLALTTLFLDGKEVQVSSSSIFAKSSSRKREPIRTPSTGGALVVSAYPPSTRRTSLPSNIKFRPEHRLTFRLTEPVPIHG